MHNDRGTVRHARPRRMMVASTRVPDARRPTGEIRLRHRCANSEKLPAQTGAAFRRRFWPTPPRTDRSPSERPTSAFEYTTRRRSGRPLRTVGDNSPMIGTGLRGDSRPTSPGKPPRRATTCRHPRIDGPHDRVWHVLPSHLTGFSAGHPGGIGPAFPECRPPTRWPRRNVPRTAHPTGRPLRPSSRAAVTQGSQPTRGGRLVRMRHTCPACTGPSGYSLGIAARRFTRSHHPPARGTRQNWT
jgi:hypothetical protein